MRRVSNWNAAKRDASVSEFLRLLGSHRRKDQVRNAIRAGKELARLVADSRFTILGIDDIQLERYRRRYAVPKNLMRVMYSVATGKLTDHMLNERLDRRFKSHLLLSGKRLFVKRCDLCGKRVCRCFPFEPPARKTRQLAPRPVKPIVVSVRGIPVQGEQN